MRHVDLALTVDFDGQAGGAPMTTERFLAYLDEHLLAENPAWGEAIRPEEWIYEPGLAAPLYRDLAQTDWGRVMAMDIYRRARPMYHPISSDSIDEVLGWSDD